MPAEIGPDQAAFLRIRCRQQADDDKQGDTQRKHTITLLIHGDADDVVPLNQSKKFVDAVIENGGAADLIIKEGGGHPWLTIHEEVAIMADWFDKQL